ncbi:MAG: aminotransferase class V-fold PLP-dependent enzyme [Candidatus Thorarchaeota archaeon]|nr:aminotransferase class V-fold PLP-dependent enzyme [Candidatus Thorarchaeota archaeon]
MDTDRIRNDFPVLQRIIKNKPLRYMDSACMSLKPRQVIDAVVEYYENFPACAGRSVHRLSHEVEEARRKAREDIKEFIGAKKLEEVVYTRNTTEGLNLVTNSLQVNQGDVVLTTDREHNSSLVTCQLLAARKKVEHRIVKSNPDSTFNIEAFKDALTPKVRLVSFVWTSNLDGYSLPAKEIIEVAHDNGSLVLLDAAQTAPHHEIDVAKLGVDFLAFSGHKMLGPTGTGVVYIKEEHYDVLDPFIVGGETVEWSTFQDHKFLDPPEKYEAGLQNYAGEIGLAAAIRYLKSIGLKKVEKHEQELNQLVHNGFSQINGVTIIGIRDPRLRGGITSFNIEGVMYHDVALIMNRNYNLMLRSGQHCVHSWFNASGIEGSVRASLYLYNTRDEVETLIEAAEEISKLD